VWSSFGWAWQTVLAVCRKGLQHDPHLLRCGDRRVGAALLRKRSLQLEEGRLSLDDLRLDLGAKIFRALSDVRGSVHSMHAGAFSRLRARLAGHHFSFCW
jgi:hypothetical protein